MAIVEKGRPTSQRWEALDALRGLSVAGMLLNLNPGAWELRPSWLDHAAWHGWTAIDMVFPAFLFCMGAALPLSFTSRVRRGATSRELLRHLLSRSVVLIVVGLLLNAYPSFDWAHVRVPGILQRIGLCGGLVGALVLLTARIDREEGLILRPRLLAGLAVGLLLLYALLLAAVPVPGFGAPRFDSVGSWPAVIDRRIFGVDHLWPYGTTGGKVTYDPEGLLSTLPACVNVIAGALTAHWLVRKGAARPITALLAAGVGLSAAGLLLDAWCPIIKKLWTSSFTLFSVGVALLVLAAFTAVLKRREVASWILPLRVFGSNALLAFVLCTLAIPVLDVAVVGVGASAVSIRQWGFAVLQTVLPSAALASFAFSLLVLALAVAILWPLYRRRWFLKL